MINLKSTVIIENNKYIFKNRIFEEFEMENLKAKIRKKLTIIILGEDLWIKKLQCINKDYDKFIEEEIRLVNDPNGDLLYHTEKDKKNKAVFIYSIKGKKLVEKIIFNKRDIEVIPIQFILLNKLKKNNRALIKVTVVAEIKNNYYVISIDDGKIVSSEILNKKDKKLLVVKLIEEINEKNLLIDNSVSDNIIGLLEENNIKFKLLKGKLCEKL